MTLNLYMLQLESLPSYDIIGASTTYWNALELQLHFNKDGNFELTLSFWKSSKKQFLFMPQVISIHSNY